MDKKCSYYNECIQTKNFFAELVCCKRWHRVTETMLWRDIVLTTSSMIALFLSKITLESAVLIHSLTLRINRISSSMQAASVETHALSRSLWDLAGNVSVMMRLNTFSVIVLAPPMSWVIPAGTRLRRTDLIDLLKSLPTSCVYLEINTDGIRWYEEGAHIWSIIVDMMIRMEHIKLQLNFICESVFLDNSEKSEFVFAPRLQTLVINSDVVCVQASRRCERTSTSRGPISIGASQLSFLQ